MSWRELTGLVIVGTVVALVCYDLLAFVFGGNDATISRVCLDLGRVNRFWGFLVVFSAGVLFGHLFFPQARR